MLDFQIKACTEDVTNHPLHHRHHPLPFRLPQVLLAVPLSKLSLPPQMGLQPLLFQVRLGIPPVGEAVVVDCSSLR